MIQVSHLDPSLNPYWLVGFVDAEGCFSISFKKRNQLKMKIEVIASFSISQHERSLSVLKQIQKLFSFMFLRFDKKDSTWKLETRSLNNLCTWIIPFFQKYSLLTTKSCDFLYFTQICNLMQQHEHLTQSGLIQIIHLAFFMNPSGNRKYSKMDLFNQMGLVSIQSLDSFSYIEPYKRQLDSHSHLDFNLHPWWITGFVDGEGSFYVAFNEIDTKPGFKLTFYFSIGQHKDNYLILKKVHSFFINGSLVWNKNANVYSFTVSSKHDLLNHIFPHFEHFFLKSSKNESFIKFKEIYIKYSKWFSNISVLSQLQILEIIELAFLINPSGKRKHSKEFWIEKMNQYF